MGEKPLELPIQHFLHLNSYNEIKEIIGIFQQSARTVNCHCSSCSLWFKIIGIFQQFDFSQTQVMRTPKLFQSSRSKAVGRIVIFQQSLRQLIYGKKPKNWDI
ncbi:MAG: hypothetical protein AB2693_28850 [Candidatus Thiodiazotropha sp.]